ncbi:PspC domain-containing protein [Amycolatopsis palatopharyngis]|uniref:PspC domain-containing protein n=1 Tax=Amycolatopsis palatopharyngis TaxID=187982 RepID=UPI000E226311|nr:PspC domain-containing protein [Amycolatopsis palatopharyngis]
MSGATGTQNSGRPAQGGFEETVKDFWASRPRRPQHGRKIAGVAAAVGNRYGIDPVVIRVALVAATMFGGVGLLFYILGWLFFADERDEVAPMESLIGRGRSCTSNALTVVLCVALFPAASWVFSGGGWFNGGGFIGLALLVAAIYLLHRSRGHLNRPVARGVGDASSASWADGSASFTAASVSNPVAGTDTTAPAWDPLGAAPLAWDLPDPQPDPFTPPPATPRPPAPRGPRSKIGPITFAIALVVAGVGSVLVVEGEPWFTPQHVVGLVLGVIGIGMVAGSFARGGRGLIGLAIPLSVIGLLLTSAPVDDFRGGVGELTGAPRTVAELRPVYERGLGNIELDLRNLPDSGAVSTSVRTGAGNSSVIVPDTADVTFTCENSIGNIECLGLERSGLGNEPVSSTDNGTDGPGGLNITLHVQTTTGNVEVRRG